MLGVYMCVYVCVSISGVWKAEKCVSVSVTDLLDMCVCVCWSVYFCLCVHALVSASLTGV